MLPIDVRLEGPGYMFVPRPFFIFNLYMGPNLFHERWAPRCVVCTTLICGSKFVPLQVDYRCVVCSLFVIIKEYNRVFCNNTMVRL